MSGAQPAPEPLADAVLAFLDQRDADCADVVDPYKAAHPGNSAVAMCTTAEIRAVVAAAQADQQPEGEQAQGLRQGAGSQ